ncbi:LysM peptidoglycan-binding domain-containing protein [Coralloluteibacterium stylophorae]|uniref:LysM peptidoglycan-binding domain-containing protein n=1 Tax=Coralloluteibacterium stylophorae TaxID=1776034 RepID=A0A8J7VUN9_9GAMM|nr:LysM peptidoglycan-binding domain-containing protein [Coralloluteibacterium stylophorae]MBS7457945.1 LysM peptidoglycan-binding domain-containing protein [Coralloluteibacterium stylophorae]
MLKRVLAVCAAAAVTVATFAVAQEARRAHPDVYVVKRGDTLWDIAATFLQKPWLWPEIWQANPQIENPHLIYPGDRISLAYLNGQPQARIDPGPRTEPVIDAVPLSEIEPFLRKLSVVDSIEGLPYVVGLEEDRLRSAAGQVAYVRGLPDAQPGQMYSIVRPTQRYTRAERKAGGSFMLRSNDLDFRGDEFARNWSAIWHDVNYGKNREALGIELMHLTSAQVTRGEGGGIEASTLVLLDEGREVRIGDRIVPLDPQPFDLQFFPHAPGPEVVEAAYGKFQVLAVADGMFGAGPRQVVALSAGSADGIDNGTVFSLWRIGSMQADGVSHSNPLAADNDRVRLPDEYAGTVMVFRTFDTVSYGLIMDSIKQVEVGYVLKHPDATR